MLQGTQVELDAQANKALTTAELYLGEQPAPGSVAFNRARTAFKTGFPVKDNVTFWFALKDSEGFRNRNSVRYDVRTFKDEAPRVVIAEPRTDRDIPADAVILSVSNLTTTSVSTRRGCSTRCRPVSPSRMSRWPSRSGQHPARNPECQPAFVKHHEIGHEWNLAPLKLAIGSIICFYADAQRF